MLLRDLMATCPRCGEHLALDEMGCDRCYKCSNEFRYDRMDELIELSTQILDQENECYILKKGSSEIINKALLNLHKGENIKDE